MGYKTEARSIPLAAVVGICGRERNRDAGRRAKSHGDEHKKDKQILHHLVPALHHSAIKAPREVRSPAGADRRAQRANLGAPSDNQTGREPDCSERFAKSVNRAPHGCEKSRDVRGTSR